MDNDLFLKKFKGRTEILGKDGHMGLMNNLHINIIGYKPKQRNNSTVKIKKKQTLDNDYSYVTSVVKEEFNKNMNFIPQLKNLSVSMKLKNNYKNKNNKINIIQINNNKRGNNTEIKNIRKINKSMENPIKLFKLEEQNKNVEKENHNKINKNKNKNTIIKLPLISSQKIESEKKYLNKNIKIIKNNSFENKKNYNINSLSLNVNDLFKQKSEGKIQKITVRNNRINNHEINTSSKEEYVDNKIQLPEYNKNISLSSRNISNQNNFRSNFDIEKTYNEKLNKLQSDLDYIKKQIKNGQKKNNVFNINNNIESNNRTNNNYVNNINSYSQNYNKQNNFPDINNNNINNLKNSYNLNYYGKTNTTNNSYKKDRGFNYEKKEKRAFTSDKKLNLFGLKNKLDIIEEEDDAQNKINNNNRQIKNKNFLEILMEQRQYYQNKISDDSLFKLNPYT